MHDGDNPTLTGWDVGSPVGFHAQALLWTRVGEEFPLSKHNRPVLGGLGLGEEELMAAGERSPSLFTDTDEQKCGRKTPKLCPLSTAHS